MSLRRAALIAALAACAAPALAESWTQFQSAGGVVFSYDPDSLTRTGDVARVRVLIDLSSSAEREFIRHVAHEEFDCRAGTRRRLALTSYRRDGSHTETNEPQDPIQVPPLTMLSNLRDTACAPR